MRFSEEFNVVRCDAVDDWFDVLTETDTPLYVDPFLIWDEQGGFWGSAHGFLIDFFDIVFDLVGQSNGNHNHIGWRQAANLLIFPEPAEFRLGVAEGSPLGAGSGKGLQEDMLAGIQANGLALDGDTPLEVRGVVIVSRDDRGCGA
jgi:hypothetical protein